MSGGHADPGPIAAVDHAVARLTADVGRLDAIDLDSPWDAAQQSRRDLVLRLVAVLDADSVPGDASHGWPLGSALGAAWAARREAVLRETPAVATRTTVELLAEIHDVHVALDVGVHPHDLEGSGAGER